MCSTSRSYAVSRWLLALAALVMAGCADPLYDVRVDYTFRGTVARDLSTSRERIRLGAFEDRRGNPNPRMILHSWNGRWEPNSGGWLAETPIADIVRDAVVQGLSAAHAPLVESSETLILTGETEDYQYAIHRDRFWTGTVNPLLTVRFRLRDARTRELLWSGSLTGMHEIRASELPPP